MPQRLSAIMLLGLVTLPALAVDDTPPLPERSLPGAVRQRPLDHHFAAIASPAWAVEAPATAAPTAEIIAAARAGDNAAVRRLLAAGASPHTADANGERPLPVAVAGGHGEIVRLLLAAGARPDVRGASGRLPLGLAAAAGQMAMVRQLLAAGANVDGRSANGATALHEAIRFGHHDVVGVLLRANPRQDIAEHAGMYPLALAAATGDVQAIDILLDAGFAIDLADQKGRTAYLWAWRSDQSASAARLLERGARRELSPRAND